MKFTPQDFLDKDAQITEKPKKEPRTKKEKPKKEPRTKKEKPKKEPRTKKEKYKKSAQEEPQSVSDETVPISFEEENAKFEEMTETREKKCKKKSEKMITVIILILIIGFCLFVIGMRGIINSMALEDTSAYTPAKSYDSSYQAALDASVEEFDTVNQERLDAKASETQEETQEEDLDEESSQDMVTEEDGITVEDLENTTSKDEQIQLLQEEIERLQQEVEDAKNDAALKEQELNQAQSLLDASTAREAQLRSDLDALSEENK